MDFHTQHLKEIKKFLFLIDGTDILPFQLIVLVRWLSQHTTLLFLPQKDIKMVGAYFMTDCGLVDYCAHRFFYDIDRKGPGCFGLEFEK